MRRRSAHAHQPSAAIATLPKVPRGRVIVPLKPAGFTYGRAGKKGQFTYGTAGVAGEMPAGPGYEWRNSPSDGPTRTTRPSTPSIGGPRRRVPAFAGTTGKHGPPVVW